MAAFCFHFLRRAARFSAPLVNSSPVDSLTCRLLSHESSLIQGTSTALGFPSLSRPKYQYRNYSHGTVNLVVSQGKVKFNVNEVDPPKKEKFLLKKRFLMQKMRERHIRGEANRRDPRRLPDKKKKQKFATAEEKIKYKIKMARAKEKFLVASLKEYQVKKIEGPSVKPHELTGEERFYLEKMAQKRSNYAEIGRRGLFGGVVLNMHLHWKHHETVKVFFKPCGPGQIIEYVQEVERLSGGIAIRVVDDDTAIFYRGKDYIMPKDMTPTESLSKRRAYKKSVLEQALATVRHYIAVSEKELELYYRHMSLYSNKNNQNHISSGQNPREDANEAFDLHFAETARLELITEFGSLSASDSDFTDEE